MLHKKPYMTYVVISSVQPNMGTWDVYTSAPGQALGGVETELDADGGANVSNILATKYIGVSIPQIASSTTRISWNARYNYRLGFGSLYRVTNLVLYKDGSPEENQIFEYNESNGLGYNWYLFGFNINPFNRNFTRSAGTVPTAPAAYYPKGIT